MKSRQRFENGRFKKKIDVTDCNNVALLNEEEYEEKYELASIFHNKCHKCGKINSISSGKRQNDEKNNQGPFDVNVKLGVGMYPHIFTLNT